MEEGFKSGDLVFAKMKGWSPWPAKVLKRADRKTESYEVEFYGTQQRSVVLPKCLFPYNEDTKNKYGGDRQRSKQAWEDALQEIEKDIPISTPPKKVKTKTKLTEVTPQPFQPRRSTRSTAKFEEKTDEGTETLNLLPPRRLSRKRSSNSDEMKDNRRKSAKDCSAIVNDNDTNSPEKETPLLNLRASDSSPLTIQTAEQKDSDDNVNDASKDTNSPEKETLLLHPRTSNSSPPTVQTAEEDSDNDGNGISNDTNPPEDHPQTPESIPSTVAEQNDSDSGKDTNSPEGETLLLHPRTSESSPPTVQTAEEMDSDNDGNSDGKDANTPEDYTSESIPPSVQIAEQNHSGNDASEDTKDETLLLHFPTSESIPSSAVQIDERKHSGDNDANDASEDTKPPKEEVQLLIPPTEQIDEKKDTGDNDASANYASKDPGPPKEETLLPRTSESPVVQIDDQKNSSWSNESVFGVQEKNGLLYTLDGNIVNQARLVKSIIIELDPPEAANGETSKREHEEKFGLEF